MKKLYAIIMLAVIITLSACDNNIEKGCVQVKVVDELCGTAILQVVSGNMDGEITASWTNHQDETYNNVFSTFLDTCDPNYPALGETFFVKIVDERVVSSCAVCLALLADVPEAYNHVIITPECGTVNSELIQ